MQEELDQTTIQLMAVKTLFSKQYSREANTLGDDKDKVITLEPVSKWSGDQNIDSLKVNLLDTCVKYVEDRFGAFSVPPLSNFRVLDIRIRPSEHDELAEYDNEDISSLANHYKHSLTETEMEEVVPEWQALKGRLQQQSKEIKDKYKKKKEEAYVITSTDVLKAYKHIIRMAPPSLVNILEVIKLVLTINVSTAEVERGFSALNRIKTETRARMSQDCLRSLLMVKTNTPEVGVSSPADTKILETWARNKNRRTAGVSE